jgi:hypothetical protein
VGAHNAARRAIDATQKCLTTGLKETDSVIQAAANPATGGDPTSVRVLFLIGGGVISGVVGWISSLINHYRDLKKRHLEDLRELVLEPLRTATLAPTLSPRFGIAFGPQTYDPEVGVSESPVTHGPRLLVVEPETTSSHLREKALLSDARKNHYIDLIASFEKFSQSVAKHSQHRRELFDRLAKEILTFSKLPPHPSGNFGEPYIMQLDLALIVYGRLMHFGESVLKIQPHEKGAYLTNGSQQLANGQPEQLEAIMRFMDDLRNGNRELASDLQLELTNLKQQQDALAEKFSYEIVSKRLPDGCDLVPFPLW